MRVTDLTDLLRLTYTAGWKGALVTVSQKIAELIPDVAAQQPGSLPALLDLAARLSNLMVGLAVPELFQPEETTSEPAAETK